RRPGAAAPAAARAAGPAEPAAASAVLGASNLGRDLGPGLATEEIADHRDQLRRGDPDLLHRIPIANSDLAVGGFPLVGGAHRLHIHRDAIRVADLVLPAVEPPDGRGVVVDGGEAP